MDPHEKAEILALLEQGVPALMLAVEGVDEEMAHAIPGPNRWPILGCAEHIAISEDYLFAQILSAQASQQPAVNLDREAKMLARGADRSRRIESPSEGHPAGSYPTLAAAVAHFTESRNRTMEFVRSNEKDLRRWITWHPILKTANCHEILISMGVHVLRHVKQIEEIKAELAAR
jgi:hypothetical protein